MQNTVLLYCTFVDVDEAEEHDLRCELHHHLWSRNHQKKIQPISDVTLKKTYYLLYYFDCWILNQKLLTLQLTWTWLLLHPLGNNPALLSTNKKHEYSNKVMTPWLLPMWTFNSHEFWFHFHMVMTLISTELLNWEKITTNFQNFELQFIHMTNFHECSPSKNWNTGRNYGSLPKLQNW